MDPMRRKLLKTGAAMTAMAAAPSVFAQQAGRGDVQGNPRCSRSHHNVGFRQGRQPFPQLRLGRLCSEGEHIQMQHRFSPVTRLLEGQP